MSSTIARQLLPSAVVIVPFLTACYSHRPLTAPTPNPATRVVAKLTDSGVVAMANAIGTGAVEVEGVVAAADAASWDLHLLRVNYRGGTSVEWNRERVTFPRYAFTHPTERTLDRRKSWFFAGALAVSAILAARLFGAFGLGEPPDTEPPPPN